MTRCLCAVVFLIAAAAAAGAPIQLDPDALSARYRNWTYYPDWIIPPICLNPFTCATNTSQSTVDVVQVFQLPDEVSAGVWRAVYLQFDGTGYETYMATSTDMLHFNLSEPTLVPGQPGCIFSPRDGRPPTWDTKPVKGDFDFGGITFIGPVLDNYTVGARSVLKRNAAGLFYYAYGAYPSFGYESAPGADGIASSEDGLHFVRAVPTPIIDTLAQHGAQPWEAGQVYAPFLIPHPDGRLMDIYNAGAADGHEQSGAAYLAGGIDALPGYDFDTNTSLWQRDAGNPLLTTDASATYQASDPKVWWDAEQNVWILIYFCNGAGTGGGANICIAFSDDQRTWAKASTPLYKHGGHPKGYDADHAHKVWLTSDGAGTLYLYYTGVFAGGRGILLLTSKPL